MATTVGPARDQADNSADRSLIAAIVWLPVRRFHVGTSAKTLTSDAGYTTATDSRVDLPTASLFLRGRSPYMKLGAENLQRYGTARPGMPTSSTGSGPTMMNCDPSFCCRLSALSKT